MILDNLNTTGYSILYDIYTPAEVETITKTIEATSSSKPTFCKTEDLFAIRQVLKEIPELHQNIFNKKLKETINQHFGSDYFVVKSIYFDKPANSNWFVAWHQDLTISVDKKLDIPGFGPWTVKQDQYAVQPPQNILENNFTIRIHLDDTDETNGALRVISGSHQKGIQRYTQHNTEDIGKVKSGGIMIMRPLLQHASNRSTNTKRRRVIHIEFSNSALPTGLTWSEQLQIPREQ